MTCPHPFRSLRFDGVQHGHPSGKPLAQVTCLANGCRTSMLIPVRDDVAAKVAREMEEDDFDSHGGALGRGSSEVVMNPTLQQPSP